MTGSKLYKFAFRIERRLATGVGFCCGGVRDPGGPSDILYGTKETKKFYDNGTITTTIVYDMTVTHDAEACEDPVTTSDEDPEFDYGTYHEGEDEVTYSGETVSDATIIDYAIAQASANLSAATWSTFSSPSGTSWAQAFAMGVTSSLGGGPSVLYSGGLASAGAQEWRFRLLPPEIPVHLIVIQGGSDTPFDLTTTNASWTPGYATPPTASNPLTTRAYPLPYQAP